MGNHKITPEDLAKADRLFQALCTTPKDALHRHQVARVFADAREETIVEVMRRLKKFPESDLSEYTEQG